VYGNTDVYTALKVDEAQKDEEAEQDEADQEDVEVHVTEDHEVVGAALVS
jgi:hypothetical protein